MKTAILVFGLPGSGKTTLSSLLKERLDCLWFNADKVRSTLSSDLDFSMESRLEQARRMGCLASLALDATDKEYVLVDFVAPTTETFEIFISNVGKPPENRVTGVFLPPVDTVASIASRYRVYSIFMNTIGRAQCRFADTANVFSLGIASRRIDLVVDGWIPDLTSIADLVVEEVSTFSGCPAGTTRVVSPSGVVTTKPTTDIELRS